MLESNQIYLGNYFDCQKLNRRFIGFEINPEYVEITKKRCGL